MILGGGKKKKKLLTCPVVSGRLHEETLVVQDVGLPSFRSHCGLFPARRPSLQQSKSRVYLCCSWCVLLCLPACCLFVWLRAANNAVCCVEGLLLLICRPWPWLLICAFAGLARCFLWLYCWLCVGCSLLCGSCQAVGLRGQSE